MTAATGQPQPNDDGQVPLRQRPIPDQLDYHSEKLAALLDTRKLDRDTLIAIGAAVVGLGSAASQLRKQAADQPPLHPEYGARVTYADGTIAEGPIADTRNAALAELATFNARNPDATCEPLQRKVSGWVGWNLDA